MLTLFNDNNSDSDGDLKINANYANIYNNFRQKEELHKLKARYGENAVTESDDESSNSSSSDDNESIQDAQFDKEFLITLACLKNDDPCIYDKEVKFFSDTVKPKTSEDIEAKEKSKEKKEKALFLRDYERKIIMERDGHFSSSEDENNANEKSKSKISTYVEEQKQLRDSFTNILKEQDEDENTDLLKIKEKPEDEKHKEEESYKEWLKGQQVQIDPQDQKMLKPLRDYWIDPNLDPNEKFLRDYILNNKYIDQESYNVNLEYNQVIHDSDENLSEDEKTIQKQEEFERKYNFRFEEPDQEFIKRYPRTMESTMRKKDTRRAQKRIEVRERKEKEKQQRREELKQLKALKKKEIEEKIEKLKEITGNNDMHFDNVDFDADFDPNEHDRKMKELFNDEYYAGGEEDQKPEFPEIDEELEIESTWDNYDLTADKIYMDAASCEEPHCEDPDFNMDADYDKSRALQSEFNEDMKKRKRRRRTKFAELIAKDKPKFDPELFPSYEKYFEQYYSLDYEDMIGDLPCRFKYRKVVPNDYGLSVEEILMADDRELNKWCSLKQALKHKSEHVEKNEVQVYKKKAMDKMLKQKVFKSLYAEPEEKEKEAKGKFVIDQIDVSNKKRKQKRNKSNNYKMESIDTDTVSKEKFMDILENNVLNNCNGNNDENQDNDEKRAQKKDVVNKSKKQKRKKHILNAEDDATISKKIKVANEGKEDSRIEINHINNKIEMYNGKMILVNKCEIARKKRKNSQFDKMKNRKSADPIMSLNVKRLKTYGISVKKIKNKLLKRNKKF